MPEHRTRYAVVGTGARAEMFLTALTVEHASRCELVALCDTNQLRMDAHNENLRRRGLAPVATYPAADFDAMLVKERVDTVVVCTVDSAHDRYIVAALEAGCAAVTEKPMTVDLPRCRHILDAAARTGGRVTVTFNYRYNPVHEAVRTLLAAGAVGEVGSVHFEWLLDVRHGADYFRRWHRDRASSGGLGVHKATHHFDLVNWWLAAKPATVYAQGRLFFYGEHAGARHGYARAYERAYASPEAQGDPFALDLTGNDALRRLYLDAESADAYHRDRNVFAPGVTIEDDLAVLVRYDSGATMSYHLTAYAPWEGYRVMVNGSKGRLELEVVESDHVSPAAAGAVKGASLHGGDAPAERGSVSLRLRPFWEPPQDIEVPGYVRKGHGGADARMTAVLFGGVADPLERSADEVDGALSILTGIAANASLESGQPVHINDLIDLNAYRR
jgi:predicted dehydrogenase